MTIKNLSLILASLLPFALAPACTSENTSTTGQMISCDATTGANCTPVATDTGDPNKCIDIDEDGDGEADDVNEESDGSAAHATGDLDDDNDGTPDTMDPDDDNDGVPDTRDCDERAGGDDDDAGDAP